MLFRSEKRTKEESKISVHQITELDSDPFADLYSKLSNEAVAETPIKMPISSIEETPAEQTEETKNESNTSKLSKFSLT